MVGRGFYILLVCLSRKFYKKDIEREMIKIINIIFLKIFKDIYIKRVMEGCVILMNCCV